MEYVNVLSHTESGTDNDLEILVAEEGGEDAEFWMALGCEDVPESRKNHNGAAATTESAARLCRFYFEGPQFKAAEVNDFSQKDLASSCAYLLDSCKPEVIRFPSTAGLVTRLRILRAGQALSVDGQRYGRDAARRCPARHESIRELPAFA